MKKLLVVLFLLANLDVSVNATEVVFNCIATDGNLYRLEREPSTDVWSLITVSDKGKTVEPYPATRLGISTVLDNSKNTNTTELYFSRPNSMFTVGVVERLRGITGYVKELSNGIETNYRECTSRSFSVDYTREGLFNNFTQVD